MEPQKNDTTKCLKGTLYTSLCLGIILSMVGGIGLLMSSKQDQTATQTQPLRAYLDLTNRYSLITDSVDASSTSILTATVVDEIMQWQGKQGYNDTAVTDLPRCSEIHGKVLTGNGRGQVIQGCDSGAWCEQEGNSCEWVARKYIYPVSCLQYAPGTCPTEQCICYSKMQGYAPLDYGKYTVLQVPEQGNQPTAVVPYVTTGRAQIPNLDTCYWPGGGICRMSDASYERKTSTCGPVCLKSWQHRNSTLETSFKYTIRVKFQLSYESKVILSMARFAQYACPARMDVATCLAQDNFIRNRTHIGSASQLRIYVIDKTNNTFIVDYEPTEWSVVPIVPSTASSSSGGSLSNQYVVVLSCGLAICGSVLFCGLWIWICVNPFKNDDGSGSNNHNGTNIGTGNCTNHPGQVSIAVQQYGKNPPSYAHYA